MYMYNTIFMIMLELLQLKNQYQSNKIVCLLHVMDFTFVCEPLVQIMSP